MSALWCPVGLLLHEPDPVENLRCRLQQHLSLQQQRSPAKKPKVGLAQKAEDDDEDDTTAAPENEDEDDTTAAPENEDEDEETTEVPEDAEDDGTEEATKPPKPDAKEGYKEDEEDATETTNASEEDGDDETTAAPKGADDNGIDGEMPDDDDKNDFDLLKEIKTMHKDMKEMQETVAKTRSQTKAGLKQA